MVKAKDLVQAEPVQIAMVRRSILWPCAWSCFFCRLPRDGMVHGPELSRRPVRPWVFCSACSDVSLVDASQSHPSVEPQPPSRCCRCSRPCLRCGCSAICQGPVAVQRSCLVVMAMMVTSVVVGSAAMRAMAFPLGLLLLALPVGERVAPALQVVTFWSSSGLLAFTGIPMVLEGRWIAVSGTRWEISKGCGGSVTLLPLQP